MNAPTRPLLAGLAFAALLAGCSEKSASETTDSAQRTVSPLIGAWSVAGDPPAASGARPSFTKLRFEADGTLEASYVAAGTSVKRVASGASAVKDENDSYTIVPPKRVRITEGTRALEYTYDVHDDKLYLTPAGGDAATVFAKAS